MHLQAGRRSDFHARRREAGCGVAIVPSHPTETVADKGLTEESGIAHFWGDIFAETGTFLAMGRVLVPSRVDNDVNEQSS
jgi:hypothetical protein